MDFHVIDPIKILIVSIFLQQAKLKLIKLGHWHGITIYLPNDKFHIQNLP